MLQANFYGSTLHITDDKKRLTSLTIYNGHPDIMIHNITEEDINSLIAALLRQKKVCPTCKQAIE